MKPGSCNGFRGPLQENHSITDWRIPVYDLNLDFSAARLRVRVIDLARFKAGQIVVDLVLKDKEVLVLRIPRQGINDVQNSASIRFANSGGVYDFALLDTH